MESRRVPGNNKSLELPVADAVTVFTQTASLQVNPWEQT